jgi:hypothetical protein
MTVPQVQRERVPNRRRHEIVQFEHGGFVYIAGIRTLRGSRPALPVEAAARDAAIVVSLALQYGVPLETLQNDGAITHNDPDVLAQARGRSRRTRYPAAGGAHD